MLKNTLNWSKSLCVRQILFRLSVCVCAGTSPSKFSKKPLGIVLWMRWGAAGGLWVAGYDFPLTRPFIWLLEVTDKLAGVDFPPREGASAGSIPRELSRLSRHPPRSNTWSLSQHSRVPTWGCSTHFKDALLLREGGWLQSALCLLSNPIVQDGLL